ncbi:hypothetical protein [Rubrolithibacter danxiaensis]|uniref:hypothetical protein n=1 Tax=Rubrolithibacter danxiaensis TaxID=3390805 RepID=UPI003BF85B5D
MEEHYASHYSTSPSCFPSCKSNVSASLHSNFLNAKDCNAGFPLQQRTYPQAEPVKDKQTKNHIFHIVRRAPAGDKRGPVEPCGLKLRLSLDLFADLVFLSMELMLASQVWILLYQGKSI